MRGLLIINNDTVRRNGRLVLIEGIDYYRQRISIALKSHYQENIYAPNKGVNWSQIFSEKVSAERILSEIRKVILKDPETITVQSLEIIEFNRDNRKLRISFIVKSIYGSVPFSQDI